MAINLVPSVRSTLIALHQRYLAGVAHGVAQSLNQWIADLIRHANWISNEFGSFEKQPNKPIGKPVGLLGVVQVPKQLVLRNVRDDADVRACRLDWIMLRHRRKPVSVPSVSENRGQDIAFARHDSKGLRKFFFDAQ